MGHFVEREMICYDEIGGRSFYKVNAFLNEKREMLMHEKTVYAVTQECIVPKYGDPFCITKYTAIFEEWS
jgi:hypothetical protein